MKTVARFLLTLVLVAAACAGGYELWDYYLFSPWTRDAHVQADVVTIAPDVAGFVDEVRVKDNQFVHKGDVMLVIDRARYTRALALADATVAARKADMENAGQQAARRAKLTTIAISDDARETAILSANSAAAAYQQAVALRSTAQLDLDRTVVHAPVNGFVTNLTLEVGNYASVGTKVMALIDSDSYRVTGYFEETKMPVIKPGEQAEIYLLDGTPPLRGHVQSIARGVTNRDNPDGPELLVNANPTFEWVRLAQRIPVRIHIDQVAEGVLVSSGMTATVVVDAPPRQWAILAALRRWRDTLL
ncbi:MAG: efflux RND transporter periplasmic adaptor subunit [Stellaceae bacterium]